MLKPHSRKRDSGKTMATTIGSFFWTADGKKTTVRTKTSHGGTKDLGDGLLKAMAGQVRVSKIQFLELVDCPLSREQYQELLEKGGHV